MKKYQGFTSIENQISKIIKPLVGKKKDHFIIINNLGKIWPQIIGEKFHQFCIPHKIKFEPGKKNDATLYIKAYNPAIAFYLEAGTNEIIEKIACYYGYKLISQIKIQQELKNIQTEKIIQSSGQISEESQKLINDNTINIRDPELKLILTKLAENIFKH